MLIDFGPVERKERTITDLADKLTRQDLILLTHEMIDLQLSLLTGIVDSDVTLVPPDPEAHDSYTELTDEVNLSWTLGHVIVHTTSSSEESAAQALSLARGLPAESRSRREVPWTEADSVVFLAKRLDESKRMRIAMLRAWPDEPNLDLTYSIHPSWPAMNAVARVLTGLYHDSSHVDQIRRIAALARAAR